MIITAPTLDVDTLEEVLIGATQTPDRRARLLAAFRPTDSRDRHLRLVPISYSKRANRPLLQAEKLYIYAEPTTKWTCVERRFLTPEERAALEHVTPGPLGDDLALLVLGPAG